MEKSTFHMGSGELPSMKWEDHYRYLGCELGRDPRAETNMPGDREDLRESIDRLAEIGCDEKIY